MAKRKSKKILVIGYTSVNLGDDLFFKILFERFPDHKFYLLAKTGYTSIFKYDNVRIIGNSIVSRGLWKYSKPILFKILARKMDGCVIIGGSIFMQNKNSEHLLNYRRLIINSFYENKKKIFVLGSNFGPFESQDFYNAYKELFSKLEDVCFRDSYSYGLFSDLKNTRYAPDIVLSLNNTMSLQKKEKEVGFSIINVRHRNELSQYHNAYVSKIVELIQNFLHNNYKVKLFSFCEREGDLEAITEVIKVDPEIRNKVKIVNYAGDINSALAEFQSCEIVIGTRFHSIILGLLFKSHVIPIYYSEKTFNYLNDVGIGDFGFWIKDIEKLTFEAIFKTKPQAPLKLQVDKSDQQFKILEQFLDTH